MEIKNRAFSELAEFPADRKEEVKKMLAKAREGFDRKIVVLDDDPTGVQTVHGVYVYTDWREETISGAFIEETDMFYILTNSRSFSIEETKQAHEELASVIGRASRKAKKSFLLISRGDSTLRGHFPLETQTLKNTLFREQGIRYDGEIICPFFPEGGRYTIENIHYVKEGDVLIPAGQTEFAKDKTFGYQNSDLCRYVEEKTEGRFPASGCITISLESIRSLDTEGIKKELLKARDFQKIIVNAISYEDLEVFACGLLEAIKEGREYLFRTAAALPKILGRIPDKGLLKREDIRRAAEKNGGLVVVGSHVKKTTSQLNALLESRILKEKGITALEFDVNSCFSEDAMQAEMDRVRTQAEQAMEQGNTAVIYTSRMLLDTETKDKDAILKASVRISDALSGMVNQLNSRPGFLIAKGGITSSDVGTKGLQVKKALVPGQVKKGIPVWLTGKESKFPDMAYVIFPGNVGETGTLKEIVEELA